MTRKIAAPQAAFLAIALSFALAACGQSKPSRHYILTAQQPAMAAGEPAVSAQGIAVGVEPVEIPKYLDKPQIVTTGTSNQIQLGEFDRWGEPLGRNITRVIAENLSGALESDRIFQIAERRRSDLDFILEVEIIRFDLELNGQSLLIARWSVLDRDRDNELLVVRSSYSHPVPEQEDYNMAVAAMSANLGELSDEIAAAIATLQPSS